MDKSTANSSPDRRPAGVPGPLVVLLLMAAFGYGVFQYFQTTQVPQGFRMTPVEANLREVFLAAQSEFVVGERATVTYAELIGEGGAIKPLASVYGETYDEIELDRETTQISVFLPEGGPEIAFKVTPRELIELRERLRVAASRP